MPSKFNVQIDTSAPFDSRHPTHNLLIDAQASNRGNTVNEMHICHGICTLLLTSSQTKSTGSNECDLYINSVLGENISTFLHDEIT